ncbi:hypothetical protein BDV96DRAFT_606802 [Lophiotrema nucula]|uniref:Extracellular membrane protein CFEM domain-containing protein n=1 Tax=Lophiotrema nucula TaxID=690887 RepID=A0A6A5YJ48_9PLEO|nr:hypothetical protein BDV96DRAFT_606802 [Lophiotrema nucula]
MEPFFIFYLLFFVTATAFPLAQPGASDSDITSCSTSCESEWAICVANVIIAHPTNETSGTCKSQASGTCRDCDIYSAPNVDPDRASSSPPAEAGISAANQCLTNNCQLAIGLCIRRLGSRYPPDEKRDLCQAYTCDFTNDINMFTVQELRLLFAFSNYSPCQRPKRWRAMIREYQPEERWNEWVAIVFQGLVVKVSTSLGGH